MISANEVMKKIAQFQKQFPGLEKRHHNTFTKSKYANLDDVINQISPHLLECGLMYYQTIVRHEDGHYVDTVVSTEEGSEIRSSVMINELVEKTGAHGFGAAITYARRYALCTILGLVESGDDDGNATYNIAEQRLKTHNEALRRNFDAVVEIKTALNNHNKDEAMRFWYDIPQDDQIALWLAPTKGGIFTTEERAVWKS